jgi:hypothetical protein
MFVMSDNPEFETEAAGNLPGDNGEAFSFRPRFVALGSAEQDTFNLSSAEDTVKFLQRTLIGLSDVVDADNNPVPFTEATRDWLIDKAHTRAALVKAYFSGVYKGALGN